LVRHYQWLPYFPSVSFGRYFSSFLYSLLVQFVQSLPLVQHYLWLRYFPSVPFDQYFPSFRYFR
jgi:hypothetical protein